jgi:hypothetical protein
MADVDTAAFGIPLGELTGLSQKVTAFPERR